MLNSCMCVLLYYNPDLNVPEVYYSHTISVPYVCHSRAIPPLQRETLNFCMVIN